MCKRSDTFSLAILIGRGLDLNKSLVLTPEFPLLSLLSFVQFSGYMRYAPLAQLVEHLTLNQGVQGSSP